MPNIFEYATKELSQDAFFCYLAAFALPENRQKFPLEARLADDFLVLCGLPVGEEIIRIKRQYCKIDILLITAHHILIIEDKTTSDEHGNQIACYVDAIRDLSRNDDNAFLFCDNKLKKICVCFLKTADYVRDYEFPDEDKYKNIQKPCSLRRKNIYELLKTYNGSDQILQSFRSHLATMEEKAGLQSSAIAEWTHYKWFSYLEKQLLQHSNGDRKSFNTGWVPTPDGSFYGCWFDYNSVYSPDKKTELMCAYKQMAIRFDGDGKTCQVDLCYKFYTTKTSKAVSEELADKCRNIADNLVSNLKTVVKYNKKTGWFKNNRKGTWCTYAYLRFADIDKKNHSGNLNDLPAQIYNFINDTSQAEKFAELINAEGNYIKEGNIWIPKFFDE